jgi:hypothetical protein
MQTRTSNAILLISFVLAALLAVSLWKVGWYATYLKWDIRDARLAIKYIERTRFEALHSDPHASAEALKEVAEAYPKWKWQRPELHLGDLVESQRASAVRDIIEYLRKQTGEDLGDAPGAWIAKYSKREGQREEKR